MNELDLLLDDSMGFDPVEVLMQLDNLELIEICREEDTDDD